MGPVEPSRRMGPLIVLLKRSGEQQAAVERLLEDQRDPASPNFHKWLTPEQYADQFGLRGDDLSAVRQWIESHGLSIDHAARGGNWIGFSGSAAQVEVGARDAGFIDTGSEPRNTTPTRQKSPFRRLSRRWLGRLPDSTIFVPSRNSRIRERHPFSRTRRSGGNLRSRAAVRQRHRRHRTEDRHRGRLPTGAESCRYPRVPQSGFISSRLGPHKWFYTAPIPDSTAR